MPAFEQDISSVDRPWSFTYRVCSGPSGATVIGAPNSTSGYPSLPCKNYRTTSNRNVFFTGKRFRTKHAQKLFEWYSRKPAPVLLKNYSKKFRWFRRKLLIEEKADWRRSRPVRTKPKEHRIPEGWHYVTLPDGKYELKSDGYDPLSKTTRFTWVPALSRSLRPVNSTRKKRGANVAWNRANKQLPITAKVNDLEFLRETGWTDGVAFGAVNNTGSDNHNYSPFLVQNSGIVLLTGNAFWFPWEDLGYSTNPLTTVSGIVDDRASQGSAALLGRWSEEVKALSKVALRRHYSKIGNRKVDAATALGESMKTVNSIVDVSKRIAKALLHLKGGKLTLAFKVLFPTSPKEAANDFLAWKYGLKPLLGDLQGALEVLLDQINKVIPFKSNGHAKETFVRESTTALTSGLGTSAVYEYRKATIRVKYGSSYSITDKLRRQAATLGFTNPGNVAWELLPLSFVVDWFLPIGDFLQALSATHALEVHESYKTVFIREEIYRIQTLHHVDGVTPSEGPVVPTPGSDRGATGRLYWEFLNLELSRETIYCKREVITLPSMPLFEFNNPISRGHINSAMALFTQLVSK